MSETEKKNLGAIVWTDLTVPDADGLRDFYSRVVGWRFHDHGVEEYNDYDVLRPHADEVVGGLCHARGSNANIPPVWLVYIQVEDVAESARKCLECGGKVLDGPRKMGDSNFAVIQDPAGAILALFA